MTNDKQDENPRDFDIPCEIIDDPEGQNDTFPFSPEQELELTHLFDKINRELKELKDKPIEWD